MDPDLEQDWSGRGQHVVFQKEERKIVNDILELHDTLGTTATAKVESVKCRRILLARKSVVCRNKAAKERVLEEVSHLDRLKHAHIVRVIGTYAIGTELAILLYPVAEYNLDGFLGRIGSASAGSDALTAMISACQDFFACLCNALAFIHSGLTKHMDIKPQNILVKRHWRERECIDTEYPTLFTVLIADFGISRTYEDIAAVETDGLTSFTRKYAAPEVVDQETRGFPADVFSMGCVFLEMYLCLSDKGHHTDMTVPANRMGQQQSRTADLPFASYGDQLEAIMMRNPEKDCSYQTNIDEILQHFIELNLITNLRRIKKTFSTTQKIRRLVPRMIDRDPKRRPTAAYLKAALGEHRCCSKGTSQLEAAREGLSAIDEEG